MNTLNAACAAENAASGMSGNTQQQPGYRPSFRRIHFGDKTGRNLTAIVVPPRRAAKMRSERIPLLVEKLRFRRFQHPCGPAFGVRTADVDLESQRARHQNKFFVRRWLDRSRNIWLFHGRKF